MESKDASSTSPVAVATRVAVPTGNSAPSSSAGRPAAGAAAKCPDGAPIASSGVPNDDDDEVSKNNAICVCHTRLTRSHDRLYSPKAMNALVIYIWIYILYISNCR